ncbi:hypothetical protein SAMN05428947_102498 [Mucilaginibacter sp. OK283]|nr:hypothetical protein SAMN05428947_102498 [Mucilaginibacter sp. OK283]
MQVLTFEFFLLNLTRAFPAGRVFRSYCTGLSHLAGIRCTHNVGCEQNWDFVLYNSVVICIQAHRPGGLR